MSYSILGLVNTDKMLHDALVGNYAVPAFNFYNMETLTAILSATHQTHSPVILAVSESAIKYMGFNMLMGLISGAMITPDQQIALHLDHGSSYEACITAIDMGFSSVMIDASKLPLQQNIALTRRVVEYAHKHNVSVEAELGVLSGIEDENTKSEYSSYTNPQDVVQFVSATNVDSLAIAIGTSHGAYKRKSDNEALRFDILDAVAQKLPNLPLVLHGASSIPETLVQTINEFGGHMPNARGISPEQLRHATKRNICKINVDSDLRLAQTSAIRKYMAENPSDFNPRNYLNAGITAMTQICIDEIKNIMGSENKLK